MSDLEDEGGEAGEGEEDDDEETWEFLSLNGCAVCNALEGTYEEEPQRPHPHCECEIVLSTKVDRHGNGWTLDFESAEAGYDESGTRQVMTLHFTLYIECCDGEVFDEPFDYEGDNPTSGEEVDEVFDAAAHEADALAAALVELNCDAACVGFPNS
jgi:hypothetical protein